MDSTETVDSIICSSPIIRIPSNYAGSTESCMNFAYLKCLEVNDAEFQIELIRTNGGENQTVVRIKPNGQSHTYIHARMKTIFKNVWIERVVSANGKKRMNDDYYADEESGNDDYYLSNNTPGSRKKDPKTLKKEREIRKQKKEHVQNRHKLSTFHSESKAQHITPPPPIHSGRVRNIPDILPNVAPPEPSSSSSSQPSSNCAVVHPPKPHFNFDSHHSQNPPIQDSQHQQIIQNQEEEKEIIMSRPTLPRFDFSDFESDLDKLVLSDTHSSMEPYKSTVRNYESPPPPPPPLRFYNNNNNNNNNNKYRSSRHRPPAQPSYVPSPIPIHAPKPKPDPSKNKKAERTDPPQLRDLFGSTQSHKEFHTYHEEARKTYSEKLKAAPKTEKNPKNYFLLPILTHFNHTIGTKIGKMNYGFHSDAGLNSKNGSLKGRDSNKYHGVDYEIPEKEDRQSEQEKSAVSIVLEVMQAQQYIRDKDYLFEEMPPRRGGSFRCQFILQGRTIADASGMSKKEAKQQCAMNANDIFKSDSQFGLKADVTRIELGIKAGKKDAAPVGFEYPVVVSYRRNPRKYRYESIQCDVRRAVELKKKNEDYNYHQSHRLVIYRDRGLFRDDARDNPSVEELYIERWTETFKGKKRNIPLHCHEYLNRAGHFIKQFTDPQEKKIWKAIWKVYRPRKKGSDKEDNNNNNNNHNNNDRNYNDRNERKEEKYAQNQYRNDRKERAHNMDRNYHNAEPQYNPSHVQQCTHFVVYDFDGTVYCQRLYNDMNRRDPAQYIDNLIDAKRVCEGFGGPQRVKALKEHFAQIRQYPNVKTALTGYVEGQYVSKLFSAIGVNMNHWFDIILDPKHKIFQKAFCKGMNDPKDRMVRMLSSQYNISSKNVLYVDDDTKIKEQVTCCEVFQAQSRGKGLTIQELREIAQLMQRKPNLNYESPSQLEKYPNYENRYGQPQPQNHYMQSNYQRQPLPNQNQNQSHYNYNNNNNHYNHYRNQNQSNYHNYADDNVKKENCVICEKSFAVNDLKCVDQMYLCHVCLSAQQRIRY